MEEELLQKNQLIEKLRFLSYIIKASWQLTWLIQVHCYCNYEGRYHYS